ncbi:MAG: MMPL family transporter [Phycisphaerae bacterium]|nr:MMPL family transporter [Phycisphaerae bacterium]
MSVKCPPSRLPIELLCRLATRRPWIVLIVATVVVTTAISLATRLKTSAALDIMVGDRDPAARALTRIAGAFDGAEQLILLVSLPEDTPSPQTGVPAAGDVRLLEFASRLKAAVATSDRLSQMCREVEYKPPQAARTYVERAIIPAGVYYLRDDEFHALLQRLRPQSMREQLDKLEQMLAVPGAGGALIRSLAEDPLGLRDFLFSALPAFIQPGSRSIAADDGYFSADRRHLMIRLRGARPPSDLDFAGSFTDAVYDAAQHANEDRLDLACTGAYAIAARSSRAIRSDMKRSILLSVVFLMTLFTVVYRNLWMLPLALAPVAAGIAVGFAVFTALGMTASPLTAVIGAILAGLGIDYCIHILSMYRGFRAGEASHEQAIRGALRHMVPAIVVAYGTTAIAFFAFSQSGVRALREFGWLGMLGLTGAVIATMLLLPALITLALGAKTNWRAKPTSRGPLVSRWLDVSTNAKSCLLGAAGLLVVISLAVAAFADRSDSFFEDDLSTMHPQPNEPIETQARLGELFGYSEDTFTIYFTAPSAESLVEMAHDISHRVGQPSVRSAGITGVYGLASLLPDPETVAARHAALQQVNVERIVADFDAALAATDLNGPAFDGYRAFLRNLLRPKRVPQIEDLLQVPALADTVLPTATVQGESPARWESIAVLLTDAPLAERSRRDIAISEIRRATADLVGAELTGITVLGHNAERAIRHDLFALLTMAAAAVIAWLLVYFRSVTAMLLTLLPVAVGMSFMLACMRLEGIKLNMVNLIALPLLVGTGVDDGIFLVSIARHSRRQRELHSASVRNLASGCRAVIMTSLTTVLTFGTLVFTSTPAIRSLGTMMALGVTIAVLGAVGVLAPLLTVHGDSATQRTGRLANSNDLISE